MVVARGPSSRGVKNTKPPNIAAPAEPQHSSETKGQPYCETADKMPSINAATTPEKLIVCCPEGFWRKGNVEVVCARFGAPLVGDWSAFVAAVRADMALAG